jgi:hypothetical protein
MSKEPAWADGCSHIPENGILHSHHRGNLKSYTAVFQLVLQWCLSIHSWLVMSFQWRPNTKLMPVTAGQEDRNNGSVSVCQCDGLEYLQRSSVSHRRQQRGNLMPEDITGPPCHGRGGGHKPKDLVFQVMSWM